MSEEYKKPNVFPSADDINKPQPTMEEIYAAQMEARREELLKQVANGEKPFEYRPELAEDYGKVKATVTYGEDRVIDQIKPREVDYDFLSKSRDDVPFDIITLPSRGKIYRNKKETIKIAYLNAADENILTNPNLIESGKFLEILFNRKMLDTDLKYSDLHIGDRNAILIWLRETAYGASYPITVFNPSDGNPVETTIDLGKLNTIYLNVDTDANGLIEYVLPISKDRIKFKFLTTGDLDDIEKHIELVKEKMGDEYLDTSTYTLKKQIHIVNDTLINEAKNDYVDKMLLGDVRAFRKYLDSIESGIDMNLTVMTSGGESINTFLPINRAFLWPEF